MSIADWLPQPPWLGPPFPKFLGILWPQLPGITPPEAFYDNEEIWEWEDWRGRQRKITVRRDARRRLTNGD